MAETEDTHTDVALISRIVARDSSAMAELYDRHGRLLFSLIQRILKDRGEAEDVLQDVFLSAWTKADTYKPVLGSPVAWLVGVARNRAIDRLRANGARLRASDGTVDLPPPPPVVDSPELHAARAEQQRSVTRALESLPAEQRSLIEEAYFLGLTQSELAARFGMPLGTVKTRVRTGMQTLRQQLQESFTSQ